MAEQQLLSGVVFLDKPLGWTSRKAVNALVRLLTPAGHRRIRAGHAGTLDPLASGMLPVLLGEATRFADYGLQAEKRYFFEMDLSLQTDTLDMEGEVVRHFAVPGLSVSRIEHVLQTFRGAQKQVPPAFSAIRVDGRRSHTLARAGEKVDLPARDVHIHDIRLEDVRLPRITLNVHCSKGTYIRSLARDIGLALGLGGCVTALRRLSTGGWPETMMVGMEPLRDDPARYVVPLAQWLRALPSCRLPAEMARRFVLGQRLQLPDALAGCGEVAVFAGDFLLGTGDLRAGQHAMVLHPKKVLPSARKQYE